MKRKINVFGAGFSGLTLAWLLKNQGWQVTLIERSSRPGGLLGTSNPEVDGNQILIETAANGLMYSKNIENLFKDLKVPMLFPRPESKKRFIWRNKMKRWPLSILESIPVLFFLLKFIFAKSLLVPQPGQSVEKWARHHLGPAACDYLVGPGLQGIYAGDISVLSASLILNRFFRPSVARKKYAGMVAPEKGMQQLIEALQANLKKNGVEIKYESDEKVDLSQPAVVATSCSAAATLLADVAPEISQILSKIEVLPLVSVTIVWKVARENPKNLIRGFGVLVPRPFNFQTLGVLSNTFIFENRGLQYHETWILGGALNKNILSLSDEDLKTLIKNERRTLLQTDSEMTFCQITRWPQALPHYTLEHEKRLADLQLPKNLYLTGNYLGSIGLSQILERNHQLTKELTKETINV
jgi:oxygen-dependent protoporphyrinogen oxidase